MGTSPDWHLCEDLAALDVILDKLGPGTEVHLISVWDLKYSSDSAIPVTITKAYNPRR
jgi:hypothetical protein